MYYFREFELDEIEVTLDNDGSPRVDKDVVSPQEIELEDQNAEPEPLALAINEEEKESDRGSIRDSRMLFRRE